MKTSACAIATLTDREIDSVGGGRVSYGQLAGFWTGVAVIAGLTGNVPVAFAAGMMAAADTVAAG